ncbi:hypothetical protein HJC03_15585 [Rhizobium sp. NLR4b]|uniref:hypothetical protein n=1 Tax=Rhizobium sp. NLR4b TaxID=2731118 RepID=UPI001C828C53|nr:hypothetical protein [Rhizobium sp. NLR4b]MBX5251813.1 hypothetical protein [Rhizobium sp. NLR4b]
MIGEIISGGLSLLGGLFGSKKPKKEKTQTTTTNVSTVDYNKMVASAREAGFNPLTALRNGGAAGFSTSTSTSNSTTTVPTTSALPGALASVGGILGQAFERKLDPVAAGRRQQDTALVDYQLRRGNRAPAGGLYAGSTYTGTKVSRQLMPAVGPSNTRVASSAAARGPNKPGEGTIVGGDNPTVSSMGWNDGEWGYFHAPWMPDADTVEQIYGDSELYSTLYGVGKTAADWGYSVYRNGRRAWERYGVPAGNSLNKWMKRNAANAPVTASQRASGLHSWPRADVRSRPAALMRPRRPDGSW